MNRMFMHDRRRSIARLSAALIFMALLVGSIPSTASFVQKPIFTHTGQELTRSLDGGEHWQRVAAPFSGSRIYQLVTDQQDPRRLYAATEQGLYISSDGGETWETRRTSSVSGQEAVLAVAAVGNRLFAGTTEGLRLSQDGGQNWQKVAGFAEAALPLTIQVASSSSAVIYVGTERHGIFRSEDSGAHWLAINQGLPEAIGAAPVTPVKNLVIDPTNDNVAYVATEVSGIYKTVDGGKQWQAVDHGLPGLAPYRTYHPLLAIDAGRPETIYAVMGYPVHSHLLENKVYRTVDGGAQWEPIWNLPSNVFFASIGLNPNNTEELLIAYEGGVLKVPAVPPALRVREPRLTTDAVAGVATDMDIGDIAVLQNQRGDLSHLFNLNGRTLQFTPTQTSYRGSLVQFGFETEQGMRLELRDNDSVEVPLPFSFRFFGVPYMSVFVGSNGFVTFGRRDVLRTPNLSLFAARAPRIAASWDDYDPSAAPESGGVFVRVDPDQAVITWNSLPQARQSDSNTFQLVLMANNAVLMTYNSVTNPDGFIGLSPGGMRPEDIVFVRLSQQLPLTFPAAPFAEVFDGEFNVTAIANRFYQSHPDDFEFLIMWGASSIPNTTFAGAFAFYRPIQNRVQGIGQPTGSFGGGPRAFGSSGRLEGILNMNSLGLYPSDPDRRFLGTNSTMGVFGQEGGHRWLAFVDFREGTRNSPELLGRDQAHWSFFFDSDASVMEGNNWRDNGNGTFTTDAATDTYSALDEYIIGLRPPSEVPDFFFIRNSPIQTNCFGQGPQACPPQIGVTTTGTRTNVSINQVIAAERPRSPAFGAAPTTFRYAFIMVVPEGLDPTPADLAHLNAIRLRWESFFAEATDGRGTAITRLRLQ